MCIYEIIKIPVRSPAPFNVRLDPNQAVEEGHVFAEQSPPV